MAHNFTDQETRLACAALNSSRVGGIIASAETLQFFADSAINEALAGFEQFLTPEGLAVAASIKVKLGLTWNAEAHGVCGGCGRKLGTDGVCLHCQEA